MEEMGFEPSGQHREPSLFPQDAQEGTASPSRSMVRSYRPGSLPIWLGYHGSEHHLFPHGGQRGDQVSFVGANTCPSIRRGQVQEQRVENNVPIPYQTPTPPFLERGDYSTDPGSQPCHWPSVCCCREDDLVPNTTPPQLSQP